MIELDVYRPADADRWDAAVRTSRNGTFLFERGFMDYHADRFLDASLLFVRSGAVVALLPQTRHGDEWRSHGGLSYGGLVLADAATATDVLAIYALIADHAARQGIARQRVSPVPSIYHRMACDEESYALHRAGARRIACGVDSAIALARPLPMATMRRRALAKADRCGIRVERDCPTGAFHAVLTETLAERHDAVPVHSASEMALLQDRFPGRIACWGARDGTGALVAGAWLFDTGRCVHAQYLAATPRGRETGALDRVLAEAIAHHAGEAGWFSFGVSNEPGAGDRLNEGLLRQKTSFGARAIACDTYERIFATEEWHGR